MSIVDKYVVPQEYAEQGFKAFRGNENLKRVGEQVEWTQEMVQEYIKCSQDPIYFIEKYIQIITEDGLVPMVLRDYQREMITLMWKDKEVMALQSRQSGKCLFLDTHIKIKHKKTGAIRKTTVGEFYAEQKRMRELRH